MLVNIHFQKYKHYKFFGNLFVLLQWSQKPRQRTSVIEINLRRFKRKLPVKGQLSYDGRRPRVYKKTLIELQYIRA